MNKYVNMFDKIKNFHNFSFLFFPRITFASFIKMPFLREFIINKANEEQLYKDKDDIKEIKKIVDRLFEEGLASSKSKNDFMVVDELFFLNSGEIYFNSADRCAYLEKSIASFGTVFDDLPNLKKSINLTFKMYLKSNKEVLSEDFYSFFEIVIDKWVGKIFSNNPLDCYFNENINNVYKRALKDHDERIICLFKKMGYVRGINNAMVSEEETVKKLLDGELISFLAEEKLKVLVATNNTTNITIYNYFVKRLLNREKLPFFLTKKVFEGIANSFLLYYGINGEVVFVSNFKNRKRSLGICACDGDKVKISLLEDPFKHISRRNIYENLFVIFHEIRHAIQFTDKYETLTTKKYMMLKEMILDSNYPSYSVMNYGSLSNEHDANEKGAVMTYCYLREINKVFGLSFKDKAWDECCNANFLWKQASNGKVISSQNEEKKDVDDIIDELMLQNAKPIAEYPFLELEYNVDGKRKSIMEMRKYLENVENPQLKVVGNNIIKQKIKSLEKK